MQYSCDVYTSPCLEDLQEIKKKILETDPSLQCEIHRIEHKDLYELTVYNFGEE